MPKIALAENLIPILVIPLNEPLIELSAFAPQISCASPLLVRRTVAEKLVIAQTSLPSPLQLHVAEGYRSPQVQERRFLQEYTTLARLNPTLSPQALIEETHKFIALPSIAGHPTGGAVDVTLLAHQFPLDMGTPLADFTQPHLIPTWAPTLPPSILENRRILAQAMCSAGFAPFEGEWWHFSYGDREWAYYYDQPHALYAPL